MRCRFRDNQTLHTTPTKDRSIEMSTFATILRMLAEHRDGVTALEYALIAAVMGVLVVTAVTMLGNGLSTAYTSIGTLIATTTAGM
jgi:pilus assembly protein Flp/PilA